MASNPHRKRPRGQGLRQHRRDGRWLAIPPRRPGLAGPQHAMDCVRDDGPDGHHDDRGLVEHQRPLAAHARGGSRHPRHLDPGCGQTVVSACQSNQPAARCFQGARWSKRHFRQRSAVAGSRSQASSAIHPQNPCRIPAHWQANATQRQCGQSQWLGDVWTGCQVAWHAACRRHHVARVGGHGQHRGRHPSPCHARRERRGDLARSARQQRWRGRGGRAVLASAQGAASTEDHLQRWPHGQHVQQRCAGPIGQSRERRRRLRLLESRRCAESAERRHHPTRIPIQRALPGPRHHGADELHRAV